MKLAKIANIMVIPQNAGSARPKAVRTAEAKNRLSELLRGGRRGARYRIFDRDTPVADLIPVDDGQDNQSPADEAIQRRRLVEQCVIRPGEPGGAPTELLRAGPRLVRGSAVAVLLEERKSSR